MYFDIRCNGKCGGNRVKCKKKKGYILSGPKVLGKLMSRRSLYASTILFMSFPADPVSSLRSADSGAIVGRVGAAFSLPFAGSDGVLGKRGPLFGEGKASAFQGPVHAMFCFGCEDRCKNTRPIPDIQRVLQYTENASVCLSVCVCLSFIHNFHIFFSLPFFLYFPFSIILRMSNLHSRPHHFSLSLLLPIFFSYQLYFWPRHVDNFHRDKTKTKFTLANQSAAI